MNFTAEMSDWVRSGRIRYREDIVEGIENAPRAFMGLLEGRNFGKLLVRTAPDPHPRLKPGDRWGSAVAASGGQPLPTLERIFRIERPRWTGPRARLTDRRSGSPS